MSMTAEAIDPTSTELPMRLTGMPVDRSSLVTQGFLTLAEGLARYHRHRVVGLDRLGSAFNRGRRIILVGNHALSVVDPMLFTARVYKELGVAPRFIGHEVGWFKTPVVRKVTELYQVIPSRHAAGAEEALKTCGFLMLFPGGASEAALRDYAREPYRLKWENRLGFLRLALQHDADIMFVAAVGSEDAYYQSRLEFPRSVIRYIDKKGGDRYAGARVPMGFFGPAAMPLPVQITHVVSDPVDLGDRTQARSSESSLRALHRHVWDECQALLDRAVAKERSRADLADRATRKAERALRRLGI
jgi:hypothetical protein